MHIVGITMRREGRVRGKPTSKSRVTGRCRQGKTRCRSCRDHPVEKSRPKSQGWHKRYAVDVRSNPSLAEFCLQPSLKCPHSLRENRELDDEDDLRVGIFVATVNSMIEAAFVSQSYDDVEIMARTTSSDGTEEFHQEFGTAVEGTRISQSASEDESWSDVELSQSSSDDDWAMVDDGAV